MGTSVRRAVGKVKKLLEETLAVSPQSSIDTIIPEVANKILKSSRAKNYLGGKDFAVLAGGGLFYARKMASLGYDGFIREYEYDPHKITTIEVQQIIEAILDDIEERDGDIQSSFILTAFKITMTDALVGKITHPVAFLTRFCEVFFEMVIRENAGEDLSSVFIGVPSHELDEAISTYTKRYVKDHFYNYIVKCAQNEMTIQE